LFVASVDDSDVVACLVECIECPVELHTRKTEDYLDALSKQLRNERLATSKYWHSRTPL
jgi:hypothetical protein